MGRKAVSAATLTLVALGCLRASITPFILNNNIAVSHHDQSIPASEVFSPPLETYGVPMIAALYAFVVLVVFATAPRYNTRPNERAILLIGVLLAAQTASITQYLQLTVTGKHELPGFSSLRVHWVNIALTLALNAAPTCLIMVAKM
jgi:uncharacterized BrkB/YihY/UPF0761 family membrane protein